MRHRIWIIALFLLPLAGCSFFQKRVSSFERQVLTKPGMGFSEFVVDGRSQQHMFNSREGSMGGFGGAGGGCGCN
ncbi:MAG: DUF4266 domain-containing protein [Bdellovibrionales bacterium]|nr:DUF4266 domain-containing protein [Bdellovibrionales bacterium]